MFCTTGMDDHQSYVSLLAARENRRPEELAAMYGGEIARAWVDAEIDFDRIVIPLQEPGYHAFVRQFFNRLHGAGAIVPRMRALPYCAVCHRWLYEAYVIGSCPHCCNESGGNSCESCGWPNDCHDLCDPRCAVCKAPAALRVCERLYFPLAPYADYLCELWATVEMPPRMHALCEAIARSGFPEVAVSHPADWGISVPIEGFATQRIYAWLEMAASYLLERSAGCVELPGEGPVQFFGFDNGYFHALVIPALLAAYDSTIPAARAFVVNDFYRLDGQIFSTSRGHAVWARDAAREVGADVLRFHVLSDRPNGRETSFTQNDLAETERHISMLWDGWLNRLFEQVASQCGSVMPDEQRYGALWSTLHYRIQRTADDVRECYTLTGFDPRRALALVDEIVAMVSDFGYICSHEACRSSGRNSYRAAIGAQLRVARELARLAGPLLPGGCARLEKRLGVTGGRAECALTFAEPAAGVAIDTRCGPVFCDANATRAMGRQVVTSEWSESGGEQRLN